MASLLDMAQYTAEQSGRVAWYLGHRIAGSRLGMTDAGPARGEGPAFAEPRKPTPPLQELLADVAGLFARDADNVRRGLYPVPHDRDGPLARRLQASRAFFADLVPAQHRRAGGRRRDVAALPEAKGLPDYYLHDFHFQNGGYLTADSARLYDTQVEVLFLGAGNAMRRQALVPLADLFRTRDQRHARLVDLGCGTGRFLAQIGDAFPRLSLSGLDLSHAYLAEADRLLSGRSRVTLVQGKAEDAPFPDESADAVTSVFLFHEVPGSVRRRIIAEAARILKPGGLFVLVDSLQIGDRPTWDGLLDAFERGFHEPYYRSYVEDDFGSMLAGGDLVFERSWTAYLSKIVVARRR